MSQFEFSGLQDEELEFERDTHAIKLQEIYDILMSGMDNDQARHRALGALLDYRRAEAPLDAYVHRSDYESDMKMVEEQLNAANAQVDERDRTINTLEYDIRDIRIELQNMEEERDMALLNLENAEAEAEHLRQSLETAEEDAHDAWNRVAELETS